MRHRVFGVVGGCILAMMFGASFAVGAQPTVTAAFTEVCGDLSVDGSGFTPDDSVRLVVQKAGQHQGIEIPQGSVTTDSEGGFQVQVPAAFFEGVGCEDADDEFAVRVMNNRGPGEAIALLAGPAMVDGNGPTPATTGMVSGSLDPSGPGLVVQTSLAATLLIVLAGIRLGTRRLAARERDLS